MILPSWQTAALLAAALAAYCIGAAMWQLRRTQARLARERAELQARAEQAENALARLREALNELPTGLEIYDNEDRLLMFNRRMLELYPWIDFEKQVGLRFVDMLNESIRQGKIPAAVGREQAWLDQRLATRGKREGPMLQSLKGGQWINTYERRTLSGYVVGVRLEVTDLVQKSRELEDSQARLQAIIQSAAAAIISTDASGVILEINEAALQMFGHAAAELIGQPLSRLIPTADAAVDNGGTTPAMRPLHDVEVQGLRRDGAPVLLLMSASEIHTTSGPQFVVIVTDLTQRRLAEEARLKAERLEAENRQIQEANRLKSQFLANMSHELRTPLNAIIGFADLLHAGAVSPESPRHQVFLGHIASSGRHLLQLINDVLDLSKVESGKFEFFPEPLDVAVVVKEVCDILHTAIVRKKIDVSVDVDPTLGLVRLDPARLKQVLYNFLSNAIKFTPEQGRVTVRGRAQGPAHFRLEVEDTGIGIAPADLPRLFNEFQQLDAGYNKQHQGTGLGLALTRRLVQAQGGTVGVRSEPGHGSVFHVVLNRVHGTDALANGQTPRDDGQGRRLLVVEDDESVQAHMTRTLAGAGFIVQGASTAAQALTQARQKGFDAMTLALRLPDQSGLGLLADIRGDGPSSRSPVVGVTVGAEAGAVASFAITDILCKPLRSGEVVAAMAHLRKPRSGPATVMVVDDDPQALHLMCTTLAAIGIDAVCVNDGRQALHALETLRPQAIVLDLMMPEMDGFAVLDALQGMPAQRATPVFIWTSMILTDEEHARLARSARAILGKGGGGLTAMLEQLRHWRPQLAVADEGA